MVLLPFLGVLGIGFSCKVRSTPGVKSVTRYKLSDPQNCCLGAKIQKKKHNSNHHHDENPSYYDSYHSAGKVNTTMIPRCNILSLTLHQLVYSEWATLSPTARYLVLCQYERFFTLSATPMLVAAHTTSIP